MSQNQWGKNSQKLGNSKNRDARQMVRQQNTTNTTVTSNQVTQGNGMDGSALMNFQNFSQHQNSQIPNTPGGMTVVGQSTRAGFSNLKTGSQERNKSFGRECVPSKQQNTFYRTKSSQSQGGEENCSVLGSNKSSPKQKKAKLRIDFDPNSSNTKEESNVKESRYRNKIIQSFRQQKKFQTLEVRDVDVDYENVCPPTTAISYKNQKGSPRKSKKDYILGNLNDEEYSLNDVMSVKFKNSMYNNDKSTKKSQNSSGICKAYDLSNNDSESNLVKTERNKEENKNALTLLPNLRKFENSLLVKAGYHQINSGKLKKKFTSNAMRHTTQTPQHHTQISTNGNPLNASTDMYYRTKHKRTDRAAIRSLDAKHRTRGDENNGINPILLPNVSNSKDTQNSSYKKKNSHATEDQNRMNKALSYAREKLRELEETEPQKPHISKEGNHEDSNNQNKEDCMDFTQNIQKIKDRIHFHALGRKKKQVNVNQENNIQSILNDLGKKSENTRRNSNEIFNFKENDLEDMRKITVHEERLTSRRENADKYQETEIELYKATKIEKDDNSTDSESKLKKTKDYGPQNFAKRKFRKTAPCREENAWVEPSDWRSHLRKNQYKHDEERKEHHIQEDGFRKLNHNNFYTTLDAFKESHRIDVSPSPPKAEDISAKKKGSSPDQIDKRFAVVNAKSTDLNATHYLNNDTQNIGMSKMASIVKSKLLNSPTNKARDRSSKENNQSKSTFQDLTKKNSQRKYPANQEFSIQTQLDSLHNLEKDCKRIINDDGLRNQSSVENDVDIHSKQLQFDPLDLNKKEEEEIKAQFNDDPSYLAKKVEKNNKKIDVLTTDITDAVDTHFSISLFLELKRKLKSRNPYWVPLKQTIDYFCKCLMNYHKIANNQRLKFALQNQLVELPFFEYHSIEDMLATFEKCKHFEYQKGKVITYKFDKILIMLRGKMIMNYHEVNESSNNNLPESQRIMQKKLEKARKPERFADLKKNDTKISHQEDDHSDKDFSDVRMELFDDSYITPESKLIFKKNEIKLLATEFTDVFIIDHKEIVNKIEPRYFRFNYFNKQHYFFTHPQTKSLNKGSLVNLAKKCRMQR